MGMSATYQTHKCKQDSRSCRRFVNHGDVSHLSNSQMQAGQQVVQEVKHGLMVQAVPSYLQKCNQKLYHLK